VPILRIENLFLRRRRRRPKQNQGRIRDGSCR
jgi:hypothetical protein